LRVFVSSTFRDMGADRDELVKRVFPRLRRLCDERGVVWGEVDLRWGITEEQSDEGEVLPICLALIDRTRPYFIGLVGECYGSLAGEVPAGLGGEESWLGEYGDRSLTELEILHGVLRDPEMASHAFFYLRDPAYIDTLPEGARDRFRESDEGSAARLDDLKGRIRGSGFPVREGYRDPVALGDLVFEDLAALVDSLFPVGSAPGPLEREAAEHEMFARSRTGVYVGGEAYFVRLDAHAGGDGLPLVVVGGSGSGKSALLAKWATGWRATHPDDLVLMHFVGGTPQSSDWAAMLRRVMGELARRFGIDVEIPDQPDALRAAFGGLLYMAAARGRVILVLDALNQLEDRQGALDLSWLPPVIPPGIRLVVSSLPGRALDQLGERGWPTLEVTPLDPDDRRELIVEYLAQSNKQLSDTRTERIVATPQAANPLYLRALIEELRVFGQHDDLDDRIGHYLAAGSPVELYQRILARYEQDFERDRGGLVRDAMSLLWAARRGLTETELLEMLGDEAGPLPAAFWSPLFLAVEQSLVDRGGLIGFFHDYLRQAIQDRYLPDTADRRSAHLRIATYLVPMRLTSRGVDELPWQLAEAQAWEPLYTLLSDLEFLEQAWDTDEHEVKTAWARLEQASPLRMTDAHQSVIQDPDRHTEHLWVVSALLDDMGHPQQALGLRGHLVEHYRQTGEKAHLAICLSNQAVTLQKSDLDGAMALYREGESICRELSSKIPLAMILGNQAAILEVSGDLDGAMTLHQEKERICRELNHRSGLASSLGSQAAILLVRGDPPDGAMTLRKEQERICRELGNPEGVAASLGAQAMILNARGDLDGAMSLLQEQERICRELGDRSGLASSLGSQALIIEARGDLDGAMALHKEKEGICRELEDMMGLAIVLAQQAIHLAGVLGRPQEAIPIAEEAHRVAIENGFVPVAEEIASILDLLRGGT